MKKYHSFFDQAVAPIIMAQITADMESAQHYVHANPNPTVTIVFPDERYDPPDSNGVLATDTQGYDRGDHIHHIPFADIEKCPAIGVPSTVLIL